MSSFRNWNLAAVAALVAGIGLAGAPAHAAIIHNAITANSLTQNAITANSITVNALTAGASAIDDLNGVAVEAVALPPAARGSADAARPDEGRPARLIAEGTANHGGGAG